MAQLEPNLDAALQFPDHHEVAAELKDVSGVVGSGIEWA